MISSPTLYMCVCMRVYESVKETEKDERERGKSEREKGECFLVFKGKFSF